MAYKQTKIPRFYMNHILLSEKLGINGGNILEDIVGGGTGDLDQKTRDERHYEIVNGNPSGFTPFYISGTSGSDSKLIVSYHMPDVSAGGELNYVALLGHNLATCGVGMRHHYKASEEYQAVKGGSWNGGNNLLDFVNGNSGQMFHGDVWTQEELVEQYGDINEDGVINVVDAINLVSKILELE